MMKKLKLLVRLLPLAFAVGCASKEAKAPERKDCTPEAAVELAAACYMRVKTECVEKGVPKEECIAIEQCDEAADARLKECRE
jgi:hypothetical protein